MSQTFNLYALAGMISTFSIIPAMIGVLFLYRTNQSYHPVFYLIFIGGTIDILNYFTQTTGAHNLWLINPFILLQFYLIVYQLYNWGLFNKKSYSSIGAMALVTVIWIVESVYKNSLSKELNVYALIFSSFFVVIFTTVYINRLIFEKITFLPSESRFLFTIALLIYFTSNMLVFILGMPEFDLSDVLYKKIWEIHNIINTFTNLIFAIGLLCIRRK